MVTLQLHESGFERAAWQWTRLDASCPVDLGEIVLQPGATIHGRFLVDDNHLPARSLWRISAWAMSRFVGDAATAVRASVAHDAATGEFWASDLPGGKVRLSATRFDFESPESEVQVAAGENIERDVWVDGLIDNDPGYVPLAVECAHSGSGFGSSRVTLNGLDHWILRGPQMVQEYFRPPPPPAGFATHGGPEIGISFGELDPGHYEFEVDDARFEPCSTSFDVPCDERPVLRMRGTSAIEVIVLDGESARSIGDATVELRPLNGGPLGDFAPIVLHAASDAWPPHNKFDDIVAGDWKLAALATGYGPEEVVVCELAARETRVVTIDLHKLGGIRGRIVYEDGTPLDVPCAVTLLDLEPTPHTNFSPNHAFAFDGGTQRSILRAVQLDAGSEFHIDDAPAGRLLLQVDIARGLSVRLPSVEVRPGATTPLNIVLEPCAWFDGKVRDYRGDPDFGIRLSPHGESPHGPQYDLIDTQLSTIGGGANVGVLARDGSFHVGPLRPGKYDAYFATRYSRPWLSRFPFDWYIPTTTPRALATFDVGVGHTAGELDLDVGELVVTVRAGGRVLSHARVELFRSPNSTAFADTDELGHARFAPIASGRWTVSRIDDQSRWCAKRADEFDVNAGSSTAIELDVPLIRRTVRVVDVQSHRLPRSVVVTAQSGGNFTCFASGGEDVTDEKGEVVLAFPAGTRLIGLKNDPDSYRTREWSQDLPDPVCIVVHR
jgi:hypothetical protein